MGYYLTVPGTSLYLKLKGDIKSPFIQEILRTHFKHIVVITKRLGYSFSCYFIVKDGEVEIF